LSALTVVKPKPPAKNSAAQVQSLLSPLNLHWAGVGLLALMNLYLIAHMLFLWHSSSSYDADAVAQQRIELAQAANAVKPLRGLDAKLAMATAESDRFYRDRLPGSDSQVAGELGALAKKDGVRLAGAQYMHAEVLAGSIGELTELRIDARLSGDYRPLVMFLNSLERDKMFFVIKGVTLTGQQSGTVNLRLRLTTYLPGGVSAYGGGGSAGAMSPGGAQ
jgi:type IV pilus assembly protein PilO